MSKGNLLIINSQDTVLEDSEAVNALLLNQLEAQAGDNQDAPPSQQNNPPEDTNKKSDQQNEESIELEAIEPYIQSNFIGSKPDTKVEVQLEGSETDLQLANFSPLNQDILSAEQAFLLEELGFSAFFNQNTEGAFQSLGLLFFDSFINSLRSSSALNYDGFGNNSFDRFDNQNSFLALTSTPTVVAPTYNGPTLARNSALLTIEDTAGAPISNTILQTTDLNSLSTDLIYTMTSAPLYGQLELTTNAGVAITTFTQDDLDNNLVIYVHNGNETPSADGFTFDITDGTTTLIGRSFDITVKDFSEPLDFITFKSPSPATQELFGFYGSLEAGNNIIISDVRDDTGASNAGSIYIYDQETGNLLHVLNNPTPGAGDYFGRSTTIDGNNLIVSVDSDDTGASDAGSIYIYDIPTGALLHTINNPTPEANDFFGSSTTIDGNNLIVSASRDDTGATDAGSIYIYDIPTGALLHTLNNPTPEAGDFFGSNTTIDGNNLIVRVSSDDTGAPNAGSIYIYDISTGALLHTINNPTPEANDRFGENTTINGNNLIVGVRSDDTGASNAGSIYIYDIPTGALLYTLNNPEPEENDFFGRTIEVVENYLIVKSVFDDAGAINAGSLYIYDISTGSLVHTLNNPTPENNDYFGSRFKIFNNTLIVSAPNDNTSAAGAGSLYIFDIISGNLLNTSNPMPVANSSFGNNLHNSIFIDDNFYYFDSGNDSQAPNSGLVYSFNVNTGILNYTIYNPTPGNSDFFGGGTIFTDNNIIISVSRDDIGATNAGSVYIFDKNTGSLVHTLNNPTPENNESFGNGRQIVGNNLIVNAPFENTGAQAAGSVYIYDILSGELLHTINNPVASANAQFGFSTTSIKGDNILISSFDDNFNKILFNYKMDFNEDGIVNGSSSSDIIHGLNGDDVLYGGGGADILFGGNGADTFVFEDGEVFAAEDRIEDFSVGENDILDISDILTSYDFGTDNISDFARFVDSGADSYLEIDADGAVGGASFESVALIIGGAGLDTATLEASGNLDAVV